MLTLHLSRSRGLSDQKCRDIDQVKRPKGFPSERLLVATYFFHKCVNWKKLKGEPVTFLVQNRCKTPADGKSGAKLGAENKIAL